MLDQGSETFVIHVVSLSSDASPSSSPLDVDPIAGLIAKEAPTKVFVEYADFAFSPDLTSELSEHTGINDHAIELVDGQLPPYGPIYSLGPVKLDSEGLY